jgi:hypothetical protein
MFELNWAHIQSIQSSTSLKYKYWFREVFNRKNESLNCFHISIGFESK